MSTLVNCPFCESTRLTEKDEIAEFNDRKNGARLTYYMLLTECSDCSERFESLPQRLENGKRIAAARSVARGAPTATQIRKLRQDWGITIAEAGALFGGGEIAFAKYEKGEIVPVQSMSKLLWLAIANVIQPETLKALISGRSPKMKVSTAVSSHMPTTHRYDVPHDAVRTQTFYSSKWPNVEDHVAKVIFLDSSKVYGSVTTDNTVTSSPFDDLIYNESARQRTRAGAPK